MELDATHKALFREIDNIEDENAYRLEMFKKSEEDSVLYKFWQMI